MTQTSPVTVQNSAGVVWFGNTNRQFITFRNTDTNGRIIYLLSSYTNQFTAVSSTNFEAQLNNNDTIVYQPPGQPLDKIRSTWFGITSASTATLAVTEG